MAVFEIKHTYTITDTFYVEADSEEEALEMFHNECDEPEETDIVDDGNDEIEIRNLDNDLDEGEDD